jgi:GxxExxY protein
MRRLAKLMKRVIVSEDIERLATAAVDSALTVHRTLGPGLLESAYRDCLCMELIARGHQVEREQILPITYRDQVVPRAYRLDVLVDQSLVLELKAVESILPIHRTQLTTYLRLQRLPLGLLINFNVPLLKDGLHRVLNLDFQTEDPSFANLRPASRLRA